MQSKTILLSSIIALVLLGCTTVIPPLAQNSGPSWDNGERNSGWYGFTTNNNEIYGIISPHARDRYNTLITEYNTKLPLLSKDYGITPNNTNYFITLEALSDFAKMDRWHKQIPSK